jgi:hypothetical protein
MRFPIVRCPFRRIAQLHIFGCGTFPQGNNFPLLWLARKFYRFDETANRLSRRGEVFCRVHFCVSFLKERDCPLRLASERARPIRTKRSEPDSAGAGQRSTEQPSASRRQLRLIYFVCWREVARSNQRRGNQAMNTTEITSPLRRGNCKSNRSLSSLGYKQVRQLEIRWSSRSAVR